MMTIYVSVSILLRILTIEYCSTARSADAITRMSANSVERTTAERKTAGD